MASRFVMSGQLVEDSKAGEKSGDDESRKRLCGGEVYKVVAGFNWQYEQQPEVMRARCLDAAESRFLFTVNKQRKT